MSINGSSGRSERDALWRRTMERAGDLAAGRRRRQRLLVTAPVIVLVLALTGGVVAAVVATGGTGGRHLRAAGHRHSGAPPSSTISSSTSTIPGTTVPMQKTGVVKGFDPMSFTAVSLDHWWVLGEVPCQNSHCPVIIETLDGGGTFSVVPAPTGLAPDPNGFIQIRFANSSDGYVVGSQLWATTDGGSHWVRQQLPGSVTALETADGEAFAITCGTQQCALEEAPVGSSAWHTVSLPQQLPNVAFLSVVGSRIVVTSGVGQNAPVSYQLSTDGGATFSVKSTPCYPGLSGHVFAAASAPSALWAACPTGMLATPFSSSDNGSNWRVANNSSHGTEFSNGLAIAPVSASTALVWPFDNSGGLALTTNGGQSYASVLDGGTGATTVWAGYSDPQRAYAILSTGVSSGELWMSSDGGNTWSQVHFTT
jgi:photosystem II stability/assembly factor-like uncharacterized protein